MTNTRVKMHTIVRVALSRLKGSIYEAKILESFPSFDDPALEREVVTEAHGISTEFTPEVLEAAEKSRHHPEGQRHDLSFAPFVTIDGETAKDFDDAICVERSKDGQFRLWVSIADVSHFVTEGNKLDLEAQKRATSVYFPDFCIPMLPEVLSNDLCSLRPDVERYTLTAELHYSPSGELLKKKIYPSKIKSQARLTYTKVAAFMQGRLKLPDKISRMLEQAVELSALIQKQRKARGSLDLDLPESEFVINDVGDITAIKHSERNAAHRLIEDFMIAANEAVASAIEEREYPSLYRVHEEPDPLKIERLDQILKHWGFKLSKGSDLVDSMQSYLTQVRGHESEKILVTSLLRSLKQAQYSPNNAGHFGLGSDSYTHFTSPIRRYPDLVVHRILRKSDFLKSNKSPYSFQQLEEIAKKCSETEREAFLAERDLEDIKKCRFMEPFKGREFDGVVTSVKSFGLFVELKDYPVEGLLPIRLLPRDDWEIDPLEISLQGHLKRQSIWLGDKLRIQVLEVNRLKRQITFRYVSHINKK